MDSRLRGNDGCKGENLAASADAQTFLEAVCDLTDLATGIALDSMRRAKEAVGSRQMELFLVGEGHGFRGLEVT
jgi:hypothetical protein